MNNLLKKRIGKKELLMEETHMLPFYYENYPFYDRALPKIAKFIKEVTNNLVFVDIGANIGDTVYLVTDEVEGKFLCIEGETGYIKILNKNLKNLKSIKYKVEDSFCSDKDSIKTIAIDRKYGTAQISNNSDTDVIEVKSKKLDTILSQHSEFKQVNLLKIDTDGYELFVLKGSISTLKNQKPVVFLEFSPELYRQKNQDPFDILKILFKAGYNEAIFYDNFGKIRSIVNLNDNIKINELLDKIDNEQIYYYDILTYNKSGKINGKKLFESVLIENLKISLNLYDKQKINNASVSNTINLNQTINYENKYNQLLTDYNNLLMEFNKFNDSKGWKIINYSRNSKTLKFIWSTIKNVLKIFYSFYKNFKIYVSALKFKILSKPIKKYNPNSNKIVFIDHSYHSKTKSSDRIILEELKLKYTVNRVFDNSWDKGRFPDLSFIDDNILAVIFWQSFPTPDILHKINNDNIILIPMYDSHVNWGYQDWLPYRDFKVFCFSNTLYKTLKKWGFKVLHVKYFVKPKNFTPGDPEKLFFWQRISQINIDTIKKLLGHYKFKISFLNSVDPTHKLYAPSKQDIREYSIDMHDWFETQEDMYKELETCGIYFAPREYEGVGLSYLEAMAMGKAVIAVNNPTMNEYIENGVNGYLYDLNNLERINLRNILKVQLNAYESIKKGYHLWMKNKKLLFDFIHRKK